MSILSMPSSPGFQKSRFVLQGNTQTFRSPLSGAVQTLELVGSRWLASYTLPPMTRETAAPWMAFLAGLNGRSGRFYGSDPLFGLPRGAASGSPTIDGASQTGTNLATAGWTPSVGGILRAGDYISFDTPSGWRELHQLTTDANSDSSGDATLAIIPPIRESPADLAVLTVRYASCIMQLASDDEASWEVDEHSHVHISFNAEEVFSDTFAST